MGLLVPVEAGSIRQDGAAGEDGDAAVGLFRRGEDAEGALAARQCDALTLELVDDVVCPLLGRQRLNWDTHAVGIFYVILFELNENMKKRQLVSSAMLI